MPVGFGARGPWARLHLHMRLLGLCLCVACSSASTLTLSATPDTVAGDGQTQITVTAKVSKGGSPADGAVVHFKAAVNPADDPISGSMRFKDADPGTPLAINANSSEGAATVTLIAPRRGRGTIDLTASSSLDGKEPSATTSVTLKPSGNSASSIKFDCNAYNIGALVHPNQESHVLCTAIAKDSAGKQIALASVETLTEAGQLSWELDPS